MRRSNKKIVDKLKLTQAQEKDKSPLKFNLGILDKLTSNEHYTKNEVRAVANFLARENGLGETHVHILDENNLPNLEKILTDRKGENHFQTHVFFLLELNGCWETLVYSPCPAAVLFKDPTGEHVTIPTFIDNILCKALPAGFNRFVNLIGTCNPNDSGVLSLVWMKKVMTGILSGDKEKFIQEFPLLILPLADCIGRLKIDLKLDILKPYIEQKLSTVHVDDEDKLGFRKAFELCKNARQNLQGAAETYEEILKQEMEKLEDNPECQLDQEKIFKAQKTLTGKLDENSVKEMKKLMNEAIPELQLSPEGFDENSPSYSEDAGLETGTKSSKIMDSPLQVFQAIMKLVRGTERTEKLESLMNSVCLKFGIENDEMLEYFQAQPKTKPVVDVANVPTNDMQMSLDVLISNLPLMSEAPVKPLSLKGKRMSQLLAELAEEKELDTDDAAEEDTEEYFLQKYIRNKFVVEIEKEFQKVMGYFELWRDADVGHINSWAVGIRGKLKCHLEGIAVMDRVFQLTTGGFRLRSPQMLSVIWLLTNSEGAGKLAQISTGEGKTIIIAALASVKILLGTETVDVLTSNEVLAAEGAEEMRTFYSVLGISVAANNPENIPKMKKVVSSEVKQKPCYAADVVYGTITNFQFDYLRQVSEGAEVRGKRGFNFVVLDEVDNLSVDNGGNIAKLAKPFPGMESLKYVYIKIWQELAKAKEFVLKNISEKMEQKVEELEQESMNNSADHAGDEISEKPKFDQKSTEQADNFSLDLISGYIHDIKAQVKKSSPCELEVVQGHLRSYCNLMLDKWIDNALYAKLECRENENYVIRKGPDGEERVIPVDYANTGVTMQNTQWSEGLHQFVQLKHNLRITCESLTSSFISNMGYVKLYEAKNICGLTGTLGSVAEREMLRSAYHVIFQVIPRYKKYSLKMCEGMVVEDEHWANLLALWTFIFAVRRNRAVLVICKTISELEIVRKNVVACLQWEMDEEERKAVKVKTYVDEGGSQVVREKVGQREIIIATNIAGRGTNFKTTKELEAAGGLHVIVSFLPVNQRVQDQAFGRTARQGHSGTAQLILKKSEAVDIGIEFEEGKKLKMETILEKRDFLEKARLKEVKRKKVKEIVFNDGLFDKFSELSRAFKKKKEEEIGGSLVHADLCEFWAFWLHKQNFNFEKIEATSVEKEFENFKRDAAELINAGKVIWNPYNEVRRADKLIKVGLSDEAETAVRRGIEMCGESGMCSSGYFKLFEIEIEKGAQFTERFKKALASLIFIPVNKDEEYKQKGKAALEKAMEGLESEIAYFKKNFIDEATNQDFMRILLKNESNGRNVMLDHLNGRINALNTFYEHAKSLIEKLTESVDCETIGLAMGSQIPHYLKKLDENKESEKSLKESLKGEELDELQSVGLATIYSLRDVHDAHNETIIGAQVLIGSGLACLASGICFPPALPFMGPIAGALISEGVCDIVIELISRGNSGFDLKSYVKGKCISFGIALATAGFSAIASSVKMMKAASKACKSLSTLLKKCPKFTGVCEKMAKQLDKLGAYFDKLTVLAEFRKLKDMEKLQMLKKLKAAGEVEKLKSLGGLEKMRQLERLKDLKKLDVISRVGLLKTASLQIGKETVQSTAISVVSVHVVTFGLEKMMQGLKPKIQEMVRAGITGEENIKQNLNRVEAKKELDSLVNEVLNGTWGDVAVDGLKDFALGLVKNGGNWKFKLASVFADTFFSVVKISTHTSSFCEKLNEALSLKFQSVEESGENETSSIGLEGKVEAVVNLLTDRIYNQIVQLVGKYANTFVLGPLVSKAMNKRSGGGRKNDKRGNDEDESTLAQIQEAFETLGLKPGATKSEMKEAYKKAALRSHPDKKGDPVVFQNVNNAYELLTKHYNDVIMPGAFASHAGESRETLLLTGPTSNSISQNTPENNSESNSEGMAPGGALQPGDGGNISTLSSAHQQSIIVRTADHNGSVVNVKEFGSKYKENGNRVAVIGYLPPSDGGVGHFFPVSSDTEEGWKDALSQIGSGTNGGNNNCLYESLAGQIGEGLMSPHELREVGEKSSLANAKYFIAASTSKLLNNPITRSLFIRAQRALLVGGTLPEARLFRDDFIFALQQMKLPSPEITHIKLGVACRNDKKALEKIMQWSPGFMGNSGVKKYKITGIDTLTKFILEFRDEGVPFVLEYPNGIISVVAGNLYSLVAYDGNKQEKVRVGSTQYKGDNLGTITTALQSLTDKDSQMEVKNYVEVTGRIISESVRNKATFVNACLAMVMYPDTPLAGGDVTQTSVPVTGKTGVEKDESENLEPKNPDFLLSEHRERFEANKRVGKYFDSIRTIEDDQTRRGYEAKFYIKTYELIRSVLGQGKHPTLGGEDFHLSRQG